MNWRVRCAQKARRNMRSIARWAVSSHCASGSSSARNGDSQNCQRLRRKEVIVMARSPPERPRTPPVAVDAVCALPVDTSMCSVFSSWSNRSEPLMPTDERCLVNSSLALVTRFANVRLRFSSRSSTVCSSVCTFALTAFAFSARSSCACKASSRRCFSFAVVTAPPSPLPSPLPLLSPLSASRRTACNACLSSRLQPLSLLSSASSCCFASATASSCALAALVARASASDVAAEGASDGAAEGASGAAPDSLEDG
mmetsp:Transcript_14521/g.30700  ORF Transcript_14521/g.30700 Transcript_14521/m.30700 type:complete len:256 (+) Transcript_14521:497-1264(+)